MSLLEVVVVIAVLGILTAVVGFSTIRERSGELPESVATSRVVSARREALAVGKPVTVRVEVEGETLVVTAMPDGRIVGGESIGFDVLAGRVTGRAGKPPAGAVPMPLSEH